MPLNTQNYPGPRLVHTGVISETVESADATPNVERATAEPGEKRAVSVEQCAKPVVADGRSHACDREKGHKGRHSFRGVHD